nr:MAG TPA: hypothetical protein [Caudoviricetes sp.]
MLGDGIPKEPIGRHSLTNGNANDNKHGNMSQIERGNTKWKKW